MIDPTLTEFKVWSGDKDDHTESKLIEHITLSRNLLNTVNLVALWRSYTNKEVAIAWMRGKPVYVYIDCEKV